MLAAIFLTVEQQARLIRASQSAQTANHNTWESNSEPPEVIENAGTLLRQIEEPKERGDVPVDRSNLCQKLREKYPDEFRRFDEDIKRNWNQNKQVCLMLGTTLISVRLVAR